MPIYEYVCEACEIRFEELVSSFESPAPPCPKCGGPDAQRVLSTFSTDWRPSFINWHRMPTNHPGGGW